MLKEKLILMFLIVIVLSADVAKMCIIKYDCLYLKLYIYKLIFYKPLKKCSLKN